MKQIFLLVSLAISLVAFAQNDGASCENAIYVDSTFSQVVEPGRTYWYVANTEDLPVMVYFFPDEISEKEPEVYVDFTCTPGVYDDPNIIKMVEDVAGMDMHFPAAADFKVVDVDGKMAYCMSYSRELLDILAGYGINYSVPVYVSFKSAVPDASNKVQVRTAVSMEIAGQNMTAHIGSALRIDDIQLIYE
jgi:hypothetical protein